MKALRWFFLITDFGFILYWLITALKLIPSEWLFQDYQNPILVAWNWSFLPLDLAVSCTGLYSLWLRQRQRAVWSRWALVSLVLTSCSGLQAISFWVFHQDFDPAWWLPNLYLLIYPIPFIISLLRA